MDRDLVVSGTGLHTGEAVTVRLTARPGAASLRSGVTEAPIQTLAVASTMRATTVEARLSASSASRGLRVQTVEHLFAALAGLGIYEGICIDVTGPEMPLLDGGASTWSDILSSLAVAPTAPRLRVARAAVIECGGSTYDFCPGDHVDVGARVTLPGMGDLPTASWTGDAADFRLRIAPARTFAMLSDLPELGGLGLARHVDPASVVVLSPPDAYSGGRPLAENEPTLHKLLDLIGDSYLYGGPPLGRVRAFRPGHTANHAAFRRALADGTLTLGGLSH